MLMLRILIVSFAINLIASNGFAEPRGCKADELFGIWSLRIASWQITPLSAEQKRDLNYFVHPTQLWSFRAPNQVLILTDQEKRRLSEEHLKESFQDPKLWLNYELDQDGRFKLINREKKTVAQFLCTYYPEDITIEGMKAFERGNMQLSLLVGKEQIFNVFRKIQLAPDSRPVNESGSEPIARTLSTGSVDTMITFPSGILLYNAQEQNLSGSRQRMSQYVTFDGSMVITHYQYYDSPVDGPRMLQIFRESSPKQGCQDRFRSDLTELKFLANTHPKFQGGFSYQCYNAQRAGFAIVFQLHPGTIDNVFVDIHLKDLKELEPKIIAFLTKGILFVDHKFKPTQEDLSEWSNQYQDTIFPSEKLYAEIDKKMASPQTLWVKESNRGVEEVTSLIGAKVSMRLSEKTTACRKMKVSELSRLMEAWGKVDALKSDEICLYRDSSGGTAYSFECYPRKLFKSSIGPQKEVDQRRLDFYSSDAECKKTLRPNTELKEVSILGGFPN